MVREARHVRESDMLHLSRVADEKRHNSHESCLLQVVDIDGTVLEKPADHAEAVDMLSRQVCTPASKSD